jgi:hypothetical protein
MGVGMMLMTGLDPDNCDDCCETLNSHGFAVVNARQVSPGAWALTPHE